MTTQHQKMVEKHGGYLHDLFQTFLDLGGEAVIEELETHPDAEWNVENDSEEMNNVAGIARQGGYCTEEEGRIILQMLEKKGLIPPENR